MAGFLDFLSSVMTERKHEDFMRVVAETMAKNDVECEEGLVGMSISMMTDLPRGSKQSFIVKAIELANERATKRVAVESMASSSSESALSLMRAIKKDNPKVHVNVADRLKETSLTGLPQSCWPLGAATDALATEVSQLVKHGVVKPFVLADLRKFVPSWCADLQNGSKQFSEDYAPDGNSDCLRELAKAIKERESNSKPKRLLSIFQWGIAFDRYAIAASATNQMDFVTAMCHKDVCLQVAARAKMKRRQWLALCYDEVARTSWSERAFANDSSLNIEAEALHISESFLMSAEAMYDSLDVSSANQHHGQGQQQFGNGMMSFKGFGKGAFKGSGKTSGACFNCGEMGHRQNECPQGGKGAGKADEGKNKRKRGGRY
jgi:hypothetical protein